MYTVISNINHNEHVFLVKDDFNRLLVMKKLDLYSLPVYLYLKQHHIENTPVIYEVQENADDLTVIEEYLSGMLLSDYVYRKGSLSTDEGLDIFRQLCKIVKALHECEPPIIHRDIKPENIIITDDKTVKLLDMNAAKFFDTGSSSDTYLLGTYGYAAPEQYGFGKASVVSDIYGLGKVLNYMLTGDINIPASGKLKDIIERCTEIDSKNRYQNIDELLKELEKSKNLKIDYNKLPGFRGEGKFDMIIGIAGYLFYFLIFILMEFVGVTDPVEIWISRFGYCLTFLALILFSRNYRYVWNRFGISRIENKWLKILAIYLIDIGILFIGLTGNNLLISVIKAAGGIIHG